MIKTFNQLTHSEYKEDVKSPTLNVRMGYVGGGSCVLVVDKNKTVRRLTPLECERLQGLPDGYTKIDSKYCSDTARYKAIGNGMAQPCADFVLAGIVREVMKEEP